MVLVNQILCGDRVIPLRDVPSNAPRRGWFSGKILTSHLLGGPLKVALMRTLPDEDGSSSPVTPQVSAPFGGPNRVPRFFG